MIKIDQCHNVWDKFWHEIHIEIQACFKLCELRTSFYVEFMWIPCETLTSPNFTRFLCRCSLGFQTPVLCCCRFTKLYRLDLSSNQLVSYTEQYFEQMSTLRELHLHNNKLNTLSQYTFKGLENLKVLTLQVCINYWQHANYIQKCSWSDLCIFYGNSSILWFIPSSPKFLHFISVFLIRRETGLLTSQRIASVV